MAGMKSRWFRFSLRTLLLLVAALCVWLAWKVHDVRKIRRAVAEVKRLGGDITYQHELNMAPPVDAPGPKWFRQIFGDEFFEEVTQIQLYSQEADDQTMELISGLPRIQSVIFISDSVTDKGLAALANANGLGALMPLSSKITPMGLQAFERAKNLQTLVLSSGHFGGVNLVPSTLIVDDSWLPQIAKLTQIRLLNLANSHVTDAGLQAIQQASGLRQLDLSGTQVTQEAVAQLQKALPMCKITPPQW